MCLKGEMKTLRNEEVVMQTDMAKFLRKTIEGVHFLVKLQTDDLKDKGM